MDILFKILLVLHIAGGGTGLITGAVNMARPKGDKTHKLIGNVFMYSMLTAACMALLLSIIHPNSFLFIVGIFTIYLTATGRRYLYFKNAAPGGGPQILDWILSIAMIATSFIFIGMGAWYLFRSNNFGIVFIVFGILGLRLGRADIFNYQGRSEIKNYWLTGHLQRMAGSYIAAVTAFEVVNWKYLPLALPGYVSWLLPTVLLVPLIVIWTRKYQVLVKN